MLGERTSRGERLRTHTHRGQKREHPTTRPGKGRPNSLKQSSSTSTLEAPASRHSGITAVRSDRRNTEELPRCPIAEARPTQQLQATQQPEITAPTDPEKVFANQKTLLLREANISLLFTFSSVLIRIPSKGSHRTCKLSCCNHDQGVPHALFLNYL